MSTDMHERWVALLREGYEAFNEGDVERVLDRFGSGFRGWERPDAPEARTFSGDGAALDAIQTLHDEFDEYRFEPLEFDIHGRSVVVTLQQSARGRISRVRVEGEIVHVWEIGPDDRAASLRAYSTKREALEAVRAAP